MQRVVVTGMGAITPLGNNVHTFWSNLLQGSSAAGPITRFDASLCATRFACEVKGFDVAHYLDLKNARKSDPVTHYAIAAVDEAIHAAELGRGHVDKNEVGVIWGTGMGGMQAFEAQMREPVAGNGVPRFSPFFIPRISGDSTSGWLAMRHGFRGINYTVASACATSNSALMDAYNYIRWGKAQVIITGGSEAPITMAGVAGLNAMKALSTRNDTPQTASRPYDESRDGFVIGEGAGALVLESLAHAQQRSALILAEIIGAGMSADAHHLTASHPEGVGVSLALRRAIKDADIEIEEIDYINAHATSTPDGDLNELKGIGHVLGEHLGKVNLSATKSMTGHLIGAAGAVEAIVCVNTLRHGEIPPTINHTRTDSGVPANLNLTLGKAVRREVNVAMNNTFGFGGHNAIVLFRRFKE